MLLIKLTVVLICGMLNGLMDAIQFHDAYRKWGYWFSRDSWHMSKWFKSFAPNAWHIAKYAMLGMLFLLITKSEPGPWWELPACCAVFMTGFNISYK